MAVQGPGVRNIRYWRLQFIQEVELMEKRIRKAAYLVLVTIFIIWNVPGMGAGNQAIQPIPPFPSCLQGFRAFRPEGGGVFRR